MVYSSCQHNSADLDSKYFDQIQNSIRALKSLVEYELALDELGCTESVEDIDRRLFEQKSVFSRYCYKIME